MTGDGELPDGGLFDHLETVPQWDFRRPLHERIQEYIDEVNPQKAAPRDPWMANLRLRTPGVGREDWDCRITDFTISVDNDLETEEDLLDAVRMYTGGWEYDLKTDAVDEAIRRDQAAWDEVDWEKAAEELERHAPDWLTEELHFHPSVFPGEARSMAEGEALVGTHPKHETLEELPGPCIMCGEDEVHVSVRRNPDGEIEETTLKCHECKWRVTGGPVRFEEKDRLDRPDGEVDFFGDQQ